MQSVSRRPLRKSTRSCTECRRRKIRCWTVADAQVCGPCTGRNNECIDQREATRFAGTNLVPKPAVNEKSVSTASNGVEPRAEPATTTPLATTHEIWTPPETVYPTSEASDIVVPRDDVDARAPLVMLLQGAELVQDSTASRAALSTKLGSQLQGSGAKSICETLRAALPSYDAVLSTMTANGRWWQSYRNQAQHCISVQSEDLDGFVVRTYTSKEPGAVGSLVTAYARSSARHDLFPLVGRLVLTDVSFVATIEGIKCLILLATSYQDIGQPRKAWTLWRQGMMYAQLMGLYQTSRYIPLHQGIWWELYHGDRLMSLMLGLPYGYQDAHLGDIVPRMKSQDWPTSLSMSIRSLMIAGKILDRNTSPEKPSFAASMKLDEEMDALANEAQPEWWLLPERGPNVDTEALLKQVLLQFYMFHIRIHIYLPFLGRGTAVPAEVSRRKCIEAARGVLQRLDILRSEVDGCPCLYECKTVDFIGFTAAVVLLICIANSSKHRDTPQAVCGSPLADEDEIALTKFVALLHQQATAGDALASHCSTAIHFLAGCPSQITHPSYKGATEIRIPHFGTIVKKGLSLPFSDRLNGVLDSLPELGVNQAMLAPPQQEGTATVPRGHLVEAEGPEAGSSGHMTLLSSLGDPSWDIDPSQAANLGGDFSSWFDSAMMDIDQEWVSFPDAALPESLGALEIPRNG